MGVVYKARHVRLNWPCALKMILAGAHAGPDDVARFLTEAEAIARIQHPCIVHIHHIGDADGLPFLELEFIAGGNLHQQLDGTLRLSAPGSSMSRSCLITSSPLVSVMVPVTPPAKMMVSPEPALRIVSRNDPRPLSVVLVTVSTASKVRSSRASSRGQEGRRPPTAWRRPERPRLPRSLARQDERAVESSIRAVSISINERST
jgi:hypothetical protein